MNKMINWLGLSVKNKVIFGLGCVVSAALIVTASVSVYQVFQPKHEHTVDYKYECNNDGTHNRISYCTDEDGLKCEGFKAETKKENCAFNKKEECKYCGYHKQTENSVDDSEEKETEQAEDSDKKDSKSDNTNASNGNANSSDNVNHSNNGNSGNGSSQNNTYNGELDDTNDPNYIAAVEQGNRQMSLINQCPSIYQQLQIELNCYVGSDIQYSIYYADDYSYAIMTLTQVSTGNTASKTFYP